MERDSSIININPAKRFGKPCVRNTRISVFDVLGWLSKGMTYNEIITDFPELTRNDMLACLDYASRQHERTPQYVCLSQASEFTRARVFPKEKTSKNKR